MSVSGFGVRLSPKPETLTATSWSLIPEPVRTYWLQRGPEQIFQVQFVLPRAHVLPTNLREPRSNRSSCLDPSPSRHSSKPAWSDPCLRLPLPSDALLSPTIMPEGCSSDSQVKCPFTTTVSGSVAASCRVCRIFPRVLVTLPTGRCSANLYFTR